MTTGARWLVLGVWGVALLVSGRPADAQAQEVATLTLEEALELARERNPAYRRALAQADAAGTEVLAGVAAFLPSVSGNLSFNGSSRTRVTGEDDFGRPRELEDPLTFRSSSASQSLSSQITLFDGLRNLNNLKAARAAADAAGAGVDLQEATTLAEVTRRFYDALQAERLIAVEERLLAVARDQLTATERLFRVAARTEVDVLGAQVQVAQQEQALTRARADADKALLRLAEQIGLDERIGFRVVGELPDPTDPSLFDVDALVARAADRNPAVQQAAAEAARADYAASAARGRRWPTVTASASVGRGVSLSSYEAFFELNPRDRSFGFGLNIQIPLFTRFETSRQIAQATANARAADQTLRERRLQLDQQVRSAHIDLVTAYRSVQLADRAVELSRRRLQMAQEQYQLGTIGFTDFQQIVTQAAQDERTALSAEAEFARAAVTLEELVGERVRP